MIDIDLTDENFYIYAAKCYERLNPLTSELDEDIQRFKYIKRLFRRYKTSGKLKERLILNHLIILANVFGVYPTSRMLFSKIDKPDWDVLKTFLGFLGYMPKIIENVKGENIHSEKIPIDHEIVAVLKKI